MKQFFVHWQFYMSWLFSIRQLKEWMIFTFCISCLSMLWVWILPGISMDSVMWGRYTASLGEVSGFIQMPACAWNNAQRDTWFLPPPVKLESRNKTFVFVWCKNLPKYVMLHVRTNLLIYYLTKYLYKLMYGPYNHGSILHCTLYIGP